MQIDKSKPVLVTGATGYVAGWLVKRLLEEGLTVHAAVRNPDNKEKVRHLDELAAKNPGTIIYFKSDLLEEGSYKSAMQGCELVYHTASPYTISVDNPQKELVEPALLGTRNVLHEANRTESVKRVVLTSSCAAIYTDAIDTENAPNGEITEAIWNETASLDYQPYSYSKTVAEKEAWKIAGEQNRWDLVVMNPSGVFGPFLNPATSTSESFNLFKQLGDGTAKQGVPDICIGIIDVRDLAEAHFQAGYTPEAHGRNIVSAHNSGMLEMAQILYEKFGEDYPIPNKAVPKWLLYLVGRFVNKALTWRFIRNNVNHKWKANNSKVRNELNLSFRPLEETLVDTFQGLIDAGVLKKK